METKRFSFFTILGLFVAIVGIIVPIVWERYKTKNSLELQHLSTTTILEKSPAIAKLKILYDSNEIDSLSKIRFALVNTGKKPIVQNDLISPPTLTFSNEATLLELHTERLSPENLEFHPQLNSSTRTVILSFPLLNPSDVIEFSILLSGSSTDYKAKARIAGIKELKIIDRAKELEQQPKRISLTVYPVGFFTLFFIIMSVFYGIPSVIKETKTIRRYLPLGTTLPKYPNKSDYLQFINQELSYISASNKRRLTLLLGEQETDMLNAKSQKQINDEIIEILREGSGARPVTVIFLILSALGIWYILSSIL